MIIQYLYCLFIIFSMYWISLKNIEYSSIYSQIKIESKIVISKCTIELFQYELNFCIVYSLYFLYIEFHSKILNIHRDMGSSILRGIAQTVYSIFAQTAYSIFCIICLFNFYKLFYKIIFLHWNWMLSSQFLVDGTFWDDIWPRLRRARGPSAP